MKYFFCLIALSFLVGCEDRFEGNRENDIQSINAPYAMREATIGGVNYLVVANSNARNKFQQGSMHFYNMTTPSAPTKKDEWSFGIPTAVTDFYVNVQGSDVNVFILDRTDSTLRVYELSGNAFSEKKLNGSPMKFQLFRNPNTITKFTDATLGHDIFAIGCESDGTLQFFDINDMSLMGLEEMEARFPNFINTKQYVRRTDRIGALFQMKRHTSANFNPSNTKIGGVSFGASEGVGIGRVLLLPNPTTANENIFAVASYTANVFYSYNYNNFDNNINYTWYLKNAKNGYRLNGVKIQGSKEYGFRGMDVDADGNFFLSDRTSNGIFLMTKTTIEQNRDVGRNTLPYSVNSTNNRLAASGTDFDANATDKVFARLGDIAVNGKPVGPATRAWVLGYEGGKRGDEVSHLYLLDVTNSVTTRTWSLVKTHNFTKNDRPQRIIYSPTLQKIIVTATGFKEGSAPGIAPGKIFVFDDDDGMTLEKTVEDVPN